MADGWLLFGFFRQEAKQAMKQFIRDNHAKLNLVQLTVDQGNSLVFDEQDDDKEISFQKVLYDVVFMQKQNGKLVLQCVRDENETSLVNAFNKSVESKHSGSQPYKTALQSLLTNLLFEVPPTIGLQTFLVTISSSRPPCFTTSRPCNFSVKVITPPPQLLV